MQPLLLPHGWQNRGVTNQVYHTLLGGERSIGFCFLVITST
jgi:hypothetical protein